MSLRHPYHHWIAGTLLLGTLGVLAVIGARAMIPAGDAASTKDGMLPNVAGCPIDKRFQQWDTFIKDGVSFRDFTSNWGDIVSRNSCQRDDIDELQRQLAGMQNTLRQRIIMCQQTGISGLAAKINDLKVEIEYVRSAINTDDERPTPDGGNKQLVTPPEKLQQTLYESVVASRKLVDPARFAVLFPQLQQKYAGRIAAYQNCTDTTWSSLVTQWNRFVDTLGGLSPAWRKVKTVVNAGKAKLSDSPPGRSGDLLGGFLDARLNHVAPAKTFDALYRELSKNNPSQRAPDFSQYLEGLDRESSRFTFDESDAQRKALYQARYKDGADDAGAELALEISVLNDEIKGTMPTITSLRQCTQKIAARECSN